MPWLAFHSGVFLNVSPTTVVGNTRSLGIWLPVTLSFILWAASCLKDRCVTRGFNLHLHFLIRFRNALSVSKLFFLAFCLSPETLSSEEFCPENQNLVVRSAWSPSAGQRLWASGRAPPCGRSPSALYSLSSFAWPLLTLSLLSNFNKILNVLEMFYVTDLDLII